MKKSFNHDNYKRKLMEVDVDFSNTNNQVPKTKKDKQLEKLEISSVNITSCHPQVLPPSWSDEYRKVKLNSKHTALK